MEAIGRYVFKSAVHKDAGSFTNQNGQVINYGQSVQVKFDEINPDTKEVFERKIKVAGDETILIGKLSQIKPYTTCDFIFDVGFNNSGVSAKLVDVEVVQVKKD